MTIAIDTIQRRRISRSKDQFLHFAVRGEQDGVAEAVIVGVEASEIEAWIGSQDDGLHGLFARAVSDFANASVICRGLDATRKEAVVGEVR